MDHVGKNSRDKLHGRIMSENKRILGKYHISNESRGINEMCENINITWENYV